VRPAPCITASRLGRRLTTTPRTRASWHGGDWSDEMGHR
jgi:hypothetical protein